ncbi:hypothetical protein F4604DRAFT_755330 [Suillus subluteus]|nr:hypothetical protein F4604DRAFT_755330 [Suillus subluteus]
MTISYPLCVFIESREQGNLPAGHPFCHIVKETVQNVVLSHPILHHMARNTLENPGEAAENERAEEIVEYLKNTCPTVSGSDSPAMDSTFVDVRAYTGCGKDPKSKNITRKHIYIQKRLVDEWIKASADTPIFLLLTIFMKLCLIRGLATAVKLSFASEDMNVKDEAHGSPCSLENFLSQWNGWLEFESATPVQRKILPYRKLRSIVFSDRASAFTYISISCEVSVTGHGCSRLKPMATGDWTVLDGTPEHYVPYNVFKPDCLRMWDSPIDPKPRKIETK